MSIETEVKQDIRPKPIFPMIEYTLKVDGVSLETYVRINRNGEYYTLFLKEVISFGNDENPESNVAKCYQRLIEHVYCAIHLYEVASWQVSDTDQTTEEDRLKKIYPFFSIKHP